MWKCASRTIRATFKKNTLRTTVLSTKVPRNKDLPHCLLKFAPALIEHCNRFYSFYKSNCENFSKEKKDREGPKEKKNSFLGGSDNNFFDVITWSGVFVLGYYLLQPFASRRLFTISELHESQNFSKITAYHNALLYLIDAVGIKPYNCVIPEVQAAKSRKTNEKQFSKPATGSVKNDEDQFIGLEKAHQKVLGTLNNWLGTQSMISGKHKEAFDYFVQSAEEENAAGIYNLGICHEKGLGTIQNFKRAAELYQKAADLGHATAMYNLGVFYAQGIGGIELSVDHARELFRAAAKLGQTDAAKALSLEKEEVSDVILDSDCKKQVGSSLNEFIFTNLLNPSASNSLRNIEVCEDDVKSNFFDYPDGKEIHLSLGSDSGVLDLSPQNEPSVLLV